MIQKFGSGTTWEQKFSYSRGKRIGNRIEIAGTTSSDPSGVLHIGDHRKQAEFIFTKMLNALEELGGKKEYVMRTRAYVTDLKYAQDVAELHGEFFRGSDPVFTMLVVPALLQPEMLVEIEMSAQVPE